MKEINPSETTRAYAFEMWMQAPNPMVTFFKTLNVSHLLKISRKKGLKFNMLMCYCIGRAAAQIKAFYLLPVVDKLMQYDTIVANTIVVNNAGEVNSVTCLIVRIWSNLVATTYVLQCRWRRTAPTTTSRPKVWSSAHRHWHSTKLMVRWVCIAAFSIIRL